MLVRSNTHFKKCEVKKDDFTMLSVSNKSETCLYKSSAKFCLSIIESIPSCILKISTILVEHFGSWKFIIHKGMLLSPFQCSKTFKYSNNFTFRWFNKKSDRG